jgi:hypothetical protein
VDDLMIANPNQEKRRLSIINREYDMISFQLIDELATKKNRQINIDSLKIVL